MKYYYKENKDFLNKEQRDYINNTILGHHFPFYLNTAFPNTNLQQDVVALHKKGVKSKKEIKKKLKLPHGFCLDELLEHATRALHTFHFLSHTILQRPEERGDRSYNSPHADFFINMLENFCEKVGYKYKEIFRISVNLTFNIGLKNSVLHCDHKFSHKQLLVYLNDCDPTAYTVILDEKNKIVKKIKPEQFKGVMFGRQPHYLRYPQHKERVIAVYTFI